jgi:hypothetical protein
VGIAGFVNGSIAPKSVLQECSSYSTEAWQSDPNHTVLAFDGGHVATCSAGPADVRGLSPDLMHTLIHRLTHRFPHVIWERPWRQVHSKFVRLHRSHSDARYFGVPPSLVSDFRDQKHHKIARDRGLVILPQGSPRRLEPFHVKHDHQFVGPPIAWMDQCCSIAD